MAVITRTVTVNAAFLQEIKDDAEELRQLFRRLEDGLLSESPPRMPRHHLFSALSELRDQLAMHFSLEEAYGYFEDAIDVAPRLSAKADELRSEHEAFYNDLGEMVEHAEQLLHRESPEHQMGRVARRFGDFLEMFRRHESAENEMIQQAFTEDLGGWD